MKLVYFPDTDSLSIRLGGNRSEGQDTLDPDVTLFFDEENRVTEILIEHASHRTNFEQLRQSEAFTRKDKAYEQSKPSV